jgi:D-glycero-alpha-D-manno-heptose 1-phosphate guanylyltransferase
MGKTRVNTVTTAIVLAGGLGTRLRSAVPDVPKPMAPINGRPFLEYQLDYWITQGISEFILSVGYRSEIIIEHFGSIYRGASVRYAIEEEPLGTGGGLLVAACQLNASGPYLVLNGDTFFEVPLAKLLDFHTNRQSDWTFSLFRTGEAGRYMGMRLAADGRIESLRSGTAGQPGLLANGGVYLVEPGIPECSGFTPGDKASLEDDILARLSATSRLFGYECTGRFIDIGIPDDYHRAGQLLSA